MMNERFLFFKNFKNIADKLPDDIRLKFYDALLAYVFDGVEPEDVMIAALITAIKPSLDKEDKRGGCHNPSGQNQYTGGQRGQKRSKEVKKDFEQVKSGQSGQSFLETGNRKQETGSKKQEDNIPPKNKFSGENIILSPQGEKHKQKNFKKPTVEEIDAYCRERNNAVDAQKFWDFYECKGWKVGKNSMKDWRAAVRTWEKSVDPAPASRKTVDEDEAYWAELAARLKVREAENE